MPLSLICFREWGDWGKGGGVEIARTFLGKFLLGERNFYLKQKHNV